MKLARWLRYLIWAAVLGLVVVAVVVFVWRRRSKDMATVQAGATSHISPSAYRMPPPTNLTGDEALSRALVGFREAVDARLHAVSSSLFQLLVQMPANERLPPPKGVTGESSQSDPGATISVSTRGVGDVSGLPVPHPLLEWECFDPKSDNNVEVSVVQDSEDAARRGSPEAVVTFTVDQKQTFFEREKVIVRLAIEASDKCVWEVPKDEILGERNASLTRTVNSVAACLLVDHVRRFYKSVEREGHANPYQAVLLMRDREKQHMLIDGIERYVRYAQYWKEQPREAQEALREAVQLLHGVVERDKDSSNAPGFGLAEYLFVHAATTEALGLPEAALTSGDRSRASIAREDLAVHVEAAFKAPPYNRAPWAHALALEATGQLAAARDAWTKLAEPPDPQKGSTQASSCAMTDRMRTTAKQKLAAAERSQQHWAEALKVRRGVETTLISRIDIAENDFEAALDHLLVFEQAIALRERVDVVRGIVRFVQDEVLPVTDAAAEFHVDGATKAPLVAGQGRLNKLIADCAGDETTCRGLRKETRALLVQIMAVAHATALGRLGSAKSRLGEERLIECGKPTVRAMEECSTPSLTSGAGGSGDEKPLSDEKLQQEKITIQRIDNAAVRTALLQIVYQCRAATGVDAMAPVALSSLRELSDGFLGRANYARIFQGALADCAVRLASATTPTGEHLAKADVRRYTHLGESVVWDPPSPALAAALDSELRSMSADRQDEAKPSLVLLSYAVLWPAVSAYGQFASVKWGDTLENAYKEKARPWPPHELGTSDIDALWSAVFKADEAGRALAALGTALKHEKDIARGDDMGTTDRDVERLLACGKGPDSSALCPVDEARTAFDAWKAAHSKEINGKVLFEAYQRVHGARRQVDLQAQAAIGVLVKRYLKRAEDAMGDRGVRLATLRVLVRLQAHGQLLRGNDGQPVRVSHLFTALASNMGESVPILQIIAADDPVDSLAKQGVFFTKQEDGSRRPIERVEQAVEALSGQSLACGSATPRWVGRFLDHVAAQRSAYLVHGAVDEQRSDVRDFAAAFNDWCAWAMLGTTPLTMGGEIGSWSWLVQDYEAPEDEDGAFLRDDRLPRYLLARAYLEAGEAEQVAPILGEIRSPEARLLQARAAIEADHGGEALSNLMMAKHHLNRDSVVLLDSRLDTTEGDAYLAFASRGLQSWDEYVKALEAYGKLTKERGHIEETEPGIEVRLHQAAASIELRKYHEVLDLLQEDGVRSCEKAQWLVAIARWARGEKDNARKLVQRLRLQPADLTRRIADPGCKGADQSLLLGIIGRTLAGDILRAGPPTQTSK